VRRRRTTEQPHLSTTVQARCFCLFGHIAQMPDETDAKKILTATPLGNWRRAPGRSRTTWMKTIQQDVKGRSYYLSLNKAIDVVQNHPLETDFYVWRIGAMHSKCCMPHKKKKTWTLQYLSNLTTISQMTDCDWQ